MISDPFHERIVGFDESCLILIEQCADAQNVPRHRMSEISLRDAEGEFVRDETVERTSPDDGFVDGDVLFDVLHGIHSRMRYGNCECRPQSYEGYKSDSDGGGSVSQRDNPPDCRTKRNPTVAAVVRECPTYPSLVVVSWMR